MLEILGDLTGAAIGSVLGESVQNRRQRRLWANRKVESSLRSLDNAGPSGIPTLWRTGLAPVGSGSIEFAANTINGVRLFQRRPVHLELATIDLRDPRPPGSREQITLVLGVVAIVTITTRDGERLEWALPPNPDIVDRLKT